MLSRQQQPAQMLSSYGLRQRQQPQPWGTTNAFDLPPVDLKSEEHYIYKDTDDLASSTSDFVKRLYRMLEDKLYPNVVMWGTSGDAFVIKDVTEFTKNCLPRAFKHSNFASFVRQLNKYDFHKVKSSDAGVTGDQAWVFKHPQFRSGFLDGLEHIKRKAPTQRKPTAAAPSADEPMPIVHEGPTRSMQGQIDALNASHEHMRNVIERLESNHQSTLRELVAMQRTVAQQDVLIQTLLQHLLNTQALDNDLFNIGNNSSSMPKSSPRDSTNMFNLSMPMDFSPSENSIATMTPMLSPTSEEPSPMKNDADEVADLFDQLGTSGKHVPPVWASQPRILLVDDDAVSRTVSARFLQDAGCAYDTANDGAVAVDKLRTTKYDLVLMGDQRRILTGHFQDIVMPHMDGLSATARIRQFDMVTPIVSMTGNGETSDVVSYMSSGMTDVLIKPFSKDALIVLLEKHLAHLRVDQQQQQQQQARQQKQQTYEFSDADYSAMMQQFINTNPEGNKRSREESILEERSAKKSRYDME
ncbi:CheY-like protein [Exidia glandulosa HHB12029]|uniref:Transcription factor n=1 Tax=Exidia glandulosa HHB12029 TaxID=1314781 RepID=A0A165JHB7_EXIGL|nr:CheY-like protein [Exidia glandulosa HHB12029]